MIEVRKTDEFDVWLSALTDHKAVAKITTRIERLALGNPGDVRAVGGGVSEMRIPYGPGYRVYYKQTGKEIVLKILGEQRKSPLNCERIQQMVKTSKFDAAEYLKTPAAIAAYLTEAFETDDAAYICAALDTAARAKGMANVAKATGLGRESLYKAFSGGSKPEFDTVRKVMGSFGVKLVAEPIEEEKKIA
jgi:probable addiction module antidote protein/putative addiction module killer protein